MPRSPELYLHDILDAAGYILRATDGMTQEEFSSHPDRPFAVERNFMIVGEALAQMRQHYPELFGQIPDAALIVAFRNRLVHAYSGIDPIAVWSVVQQDVRPLRIAVESLLRQSSSARGG